MREKKAVCLSAANRINGKEYQDCGQICRLVAGAFAARKIPCGILELGEVPLFPCRGCDRCLKEGKCVWDRDFNRIYEEIKQADYLFFLAPFCAPVPSRLSILFEKMKLDPTRNSFRESGAASPLAGKFAGVVTYEDAGGRRKEKREHRVAANDILADALEELKVKIVPFNSKWSTGILISDNVLAQKEGEYSAEEAIRTYVEIMIQTSRIAHVIL